MGASEYRRLDEQVDLNQQGSAYICVMNRVSVSFMNQYRKHSTIFEITQYLLVCLPHIYSPPFSHRLKADDTEGINVQDEQCIGMKVIVTNQKLKREWKQSLDIKITY